MAEGDIGSVIDTALFDATKGGAPRVVLVSATVVAIAYIGPDNHGWLKTMSIDSEGAIGAIGELEFDTGRGICPDIIHVTGDIYAIAYRGVDDDGFIKTVDIDSSGVIGTVKDTEEFDAEFCDHPTIVHVAGEVYAIAYDSDDIATVSIDALGEITFEDHGNFDDLGAVNSFPHIIKIADTIFAIAYTGSGSDGWLKTVSIANDGTIGAVLDFLEFDTTLGMKPRITHVTGDIYAIVYEDPTLVGRAITVDIDASGNIGAGVIDTLVFESIDVSLPDITWVSGDVFAITWNDDTQGEDGWIKTYHINADGTFGALEDQLEFESLMVGTSHLLYVGGNIWTIVYDVGSGGQGKIITLDIETFRAPVGFGGNPSDVLVKNALI